MSVSSGRERAQDVRPSVSAGHGCPDHSAATPPTREIWESAQTPTRGASGQAPSRGPWISAPAPEPLPRTEAPLSHPKGHSGPPTAPWNPPRGREEGSADRLRASSSWLLKTRQPPRERETAGPAQPRCLCGPRPSAASGHRRPRDPQPRPPAWRHGLRPGTCWARATASGTFPALLAAWQPNLAPEPTHRGASGADGRAAGRFGPRKPTWCRLVPIRAPSRGPEPPSHWGSSAWKPPGTTDTGGWP